MKLHYTNTNNKNKPYIPSHTPTNTSRVLSECDVQTSFYDNDPDMKSVKENFDRQTSQRFEEYEERLMKNRKKCKEHCDKDIQKIILKDKMEKSLAEKVEIGCLKCGCGLGGVAAGVGIIGAVAVKEWTKAALLAAEKEALVEGTAEATKAGFDFGIQYIITEIKNQLKIYSIASSPLDKVITAETLNNPKQLIESLNIQYTDLCVTNGYKLEESLCSMAGEDHLQAISFIDRHINNIVGYAKQSADAHTSKITSETILKLTETKNAAVESTSVTCNTAIIASVVAILIIVLVMVITYLILRYRRKKKMKKKQQYTKLLKE
ncbi:PIR protein, putative [Plasmodium sp.]|nr:PIR protein, putative [Plasmodium sp.]